MNITLLEFSEEHLGKLEQWCQNIQSDQYMSRYSPHAFDGENVPPFEICNWYVIVVNDKETGTLWLEKTDPKTDIANLGILIGNAEKLGKGIGTSAIQSAISASKNNLCFRRVHLNVRKENTRAIACYRKVGFSIISEGVKRKAGCSIPYATMEMIVG